MRIPQWLSLLIAGAVLLFGAYRLWLAFGGPSDEERAKRKRGLLAMPRRQHGAIGLLYLIVGGALLATSFGWNPFASSSKPVPTVPVDQGNTGTGPKAIPVGP